MFKALHTISSGVQSTGKKERNKLKPKAWCKQCTKTVQTQHTVFKAPQTISSDVKRTGKNGKTLIETQSLVYTVYTDCKNTAYSVQSYANTFKWCKENREKGEAQIKTQSQV